MLHVLLRDDDKLFLNRVTSRVEAFLRSQGEIKQKYLLWKQPR